MKIRDAYTSGKLADHVLIHAKLVKVVTLEPFVRLSGSTVTLHLEAAKHPYMHAAGYTEERNFQIDGETLTMTNARGGIRKFTRVE